MQVRIGVRRAIVVDNNVDTFHINTTAKDIRGNQDTLLESLESSVTVDTGQ